MIQNINAPSPAASRSRRAQHLPSVLTLSDLSREERMLEAGQAMLQSVQLAGKQALMAGIRFNVLTDSTPALFEDVPFLREVDTVVFDFAVGSVRSDLVIFHFDGSVSLIDVRDGTEGYMHVLAGIGHVGACAAGLGLGSVRFMKVRRALLWSGTESLLTDLLVTLACEQADVLPIPFATLEEMTACTRRALEGAA